MPWFLGIDPGKTGCACFLTHDKKEVVFIDWSKENNYAEMYNLFITSVPTPVRHAVLEKVSSMPGQGVKSMFSFGENNGAWKMLLTCREISYHLVPPQAWHKGVVFKTEGPDPKSRAFNAACRLFPQFVKHLKGSKCGIMSGRVDALLMAHYASTLNPFTSLPQPRKRG